MSRTAFYRQIVHQEQLHEKQSLKFSKDALDQYEVSYSLCDEILFDIEEYIDLRDDLDRQASSLILVKALGTMQSIRWLFLKGYYFDAAALHRTFMENLGDCCYISQNKGSGEKWFKDEKTSHARTADKFKAISKTLKQDIPEEQTDTFYHILCKYVHGNRPAVMTLISEVEDEYDLDEALSTIRFRNPSSYNKGMVDSIANLPVVVLLVIQELFPEISDYDKEQIAEMQMSRYKACESANH
jgi:hypothetical protein